MSDIMTIPKKGSRQITVEGQVYRWLIKSKPTYAQECLEAPMTAAVDLVEGGGTTLYITFPFSRPDGLYRTQISITPQVIRDCIQAALAQGWQPNNEGGAFYYSYRFTTS